MLTRKERDRAYHVLMYGVSEENRIMKLPREELLRRDEVGPRRIGVARKREELFVIVLG